MRDTICAISTATGQGAMAIVRITGNEALLIASKVFSYKSGSRILENELSHTVHFGRIIDNNILIDEVMLSLFKSPGTYTGEDIVEITCHGSVFIQQKILHLLIKNGARLASPGEFTQRAYLNGKMDLSQAEAVSDLISSSTEAAHKIAMNQMRGGISNELALLRQELLQFISLIELELDFSEEDVEFADRTQLKSIVDKLIKLIDKLIGSFKLGNAIKNGIPVAIVGEPNVGKSTLLNAILGDEKAIVSDIAGTTRDAIEDTFVFNGITYRFIDTAGLRETSDVIESIGIERTYRKIEQASIILAMFDIKKTLQEIEHELTKLIDKTDGDKKIIVVLNKADNNEVCSYDFRDKAFATISISAKSYYNIDKLFDLLNSISGIEQLENNSVIVSNVRHLEALELSKQSLERAVLGMDLGVTHDFLAMDIREAIHYLAGITGEEITTDEVLGNIFGQFCIGK